MKSPVFVHLALLLSVSLPCYANNIESKGNDMTGMPALTNTNTLTNTTSSGIDTSSPEHIAWKTANIAGTNNFRLGQYAEAEKNFTQAVKQAENFGPNDKRLAESLNNLALALFQQGKYIDALPLYTRALPIYEKAVGVNDIVYAKVVSNLGMVYYKLHNFAEAEKLYKRAIKIGEKSVGQTNPSSSLALNNLAALYVAEHKYTEAEPLYLQASGIQEKTVGPQAPELALTLYNLGALYSKEGRFVEAEPVCKRSVDIDEKVLVPGHPQTMKALQAYSGLLRRLNRNDEAMQVDARLKSMQGGVAAASLAHSNNNSGNSTAEKQAENTSSSIVGVIPTTETQLYMAEVERRIKSLWNCPVKSRSVKVETKFRILTDGSVFSPSVINSSQESEVDKSALDVLAKAKLPPPPSCCGIEPWVAFTFAVNVQSSPYSAVIKEWQDRLQQNDTADNHVGLAQVYEQANIYDAAEEQIKKAIAMDPGNAYYKELLNRCQQKSKTSSTAF